MSSPPPPPPPPPGPPPPFTTPPAWDKRAYRAQRRAAHLAVRQQRTLQRLQMRSARKRSIVGPVLLVSSGLFLLVTEAAHIQGNLLLFWLARWWPLLLLGAGLILAAEWAIDTRSVVQGQGPAARRTLGPIATILLVFATLTGVLAMGLQNSRDWLRGNWPAGFADSWSLDQLFAQHQETTRELSAPLPSGALLTVQNYRGDISVSGASPDGLVHISVHQRLEAMRQDQLQARERQDQPQLKRDGSGLQLLVPGSDRDRADLTIQVPHESALQIAGERGSLAISEVRGTITISDHSGDISLTGLTGPVQVSTQDDNGTITGHSLSGDLTVQGRGGDLSLSDVSGTIALHGDFFGTTHLERIRGPLHFQSSFTDLTCAGVPGDLTVEGRSELQGNDLDGPVILRTTDRNITLNGVRHGLTVTNRNGAVDVSVAEPLAPLSVTNTAGPIHLHVPEQAAFALSANTRNGNISNDLGLTPEKSDDDAMLTGHVKKGGPTFLLETSGGDITVEHLQKSATAEDVPHPSRKRSDDDDDDD